jgi:hypothetical protein
MASVIIVYYNVWFYYPSIRDAFLAEFFAGFSGILIAFYLDRMFEMHKRIKTSKLMVYSFLLELRENLSVFNISRNQSKESTNREMRMPDSFYFFQTNTWKMLSSRLELDNVVVLYNLGIVDYSLSILMK